jgi:carboxymethylenebutenolidase
MCFDHDSSPPNLPADLVLAPVGGGAAAELLELTSADGTRFSAALAMAADASGPAVLIFPDVRGLYRFYVELAERFAAAGHNAIAIDYFGRTAGVGTRGEDFDFWPHMRETRPELIQADAAAAIAALRERTGEDTQVVSVGFCFGGSMSFLADTNESLGLAGTVGFYAGLDLSRFGLTGPLDRAADIRGPLLGLYGGADEGIPVEVVNEFDRRLTEAGVPHEIEIYPGAPHSFFDRKYEQYAEACEDAWRRVLAFLAELPAAAPAGV